MLKSIIARLGKVHTYDMFLWGLFLSLWVKLFFLEEYTGVYNCTLITVWGVGLVLVISKAKDDIIKAINQAKEKV